MLSISSSISFPIQLFIPSEKKVTALLPIIHSPSEGNQLSDESLKSNSIRKNQYRHTTMFTQPGNYQNEAIDMFPK